MTNEIKISGKLTAQPVLRKAKNNKFFATFSVGVAREDSKFIDYINCICWDNDLAQQIAACGMRDSEVAVAGTLQTNQYQNKHQETCKSYEVVTTLFKVKRGTGTQPTNNTQAAPVANRQNANAPVATTTNAAPNTSVAPTTPNNNLQAALDSIEQTTDFDPTI